ncbi:MAG: hypothetical protein M3322_02440 [Actinomycetota bacterium]|nr:hypothetical protein [Actinomycetota bacterium]
MRSRSLRRFLLVGLLVFLVAIPAVAAARRPRAGDGTLSVRDGRGTVQIVARGSTIGSIDRGEVVATDGNPRDDNYPALSGGRVTKLSGRVEARRGKNIRFRLVGGFHRVKIVGSGIDLSAVGRGSVTLDGDERSGDTGEYSLNNQEFAPLPAEPTPLKLAPPPPPPPGG